LVEILGVVAILAILAALLFPMFARSKERGKRASCASRLRRFATAMSLYRADHDGKGYRWSIDGTKPSDPMPFGEFTGMKGYLADGALLDCAEPSPDPVFGSTRIVYRTVLTRPSRVDPDRIVQVPLEPRPGTVVAYCGNHAHDGWDPRYGGSMIRAGRYPFVREDSSAGVAGGEKVKPGFYDEKGWYEEPQPGVTSFILCFPGEAWPPAPEE